MPDPQKALATQLANIEKRTGKSLAELSAVVRDSGLAKHGELVAMLKAKLGMGHGDANTLVHMVLKPRDGAGGESPASPAQALDALYAGPKAALRPIHERLLAAMRALGPFDEAPKQAYVSYRRKRQFAMIGPATRTSVEVGLNAKGLPATGRLQAVAPGQMCNYKVRLSSVDEADDEVLGWIRTAYEAAG